ncbi:MAG: hypothetical protein ACRD2O_15875, partial [Terriglobia bacterium]
TPLCSAALRAPKPLKVLRAGPRVAAGQASSGVRGRPQDLVKNYMRNDIRNPWVDHLFGPLKSKLTSRLNPFGQFICNKPVMV